jgi:molybdopterin molybdotransferase
MVGFKQAYEAVMDSVAPLDTERVQLGATYGRVLAEDVFSDIDIPPFDKSAMDGYAVRTRDLQRPPVVLSVHDTLAAGSAMSGVVEEGACVRIMTGAPIPGDFDAVVKFEDSEEHDGGVRFTRPVEPGQNICKRGEDIVRGRQVLKSGSIIGGPEVAVLASVGMIRVKVFRNPRVSVLSTGSEVVEPGQPLVFGMIRNSNGPMLSSLVSAAGAEVDYLGIAPDREDELTGLIERGTAGDLLLISGGVSMGDYDLIPGILRSIGAEIRLHRVKIKPGKPLLLAKRGACVIIGIPGNPVSNFTTFHTFIKPALYKMMGCSDYALRFVNGVAGEEISKKGERPQLMPSTYRVVEGGFVVKPLPLNGSADIVGSAGCTCLLFVDEGDQNIKAGEKVPILLIKI